MLPDRSFYSRIAPLIGLFAGLFVGSALSDEIGAAVMFAWMMR